jgi:Zn2+/Cd2+-exporting ATPase
MTESQSTEAKGSPPEQNCLVRSVLAAFKVEPSLEAITVNQAHRTISVATLGKADEARLSEQITTTVQEAHAAAAGGRCGLLDGSTDCTTCEWPLSPLERRAITIKQDGDATTIARVTCPTAPRFWHWRDIPWPKVVQRDVEFLESAEHAEEWKPQLLAAILCGVLGLTAYLLRDNRLAFLFYALAYLAGGWFTVHEVWERLRQRTIDVHFLMLAVALGSASIGAWGEGAMLLFLFSFSGALEHYAMGRTQREIHALFKDAPKLAIVLDEQGHEREVPVARLRPRIRLLVKPGAQFPVDAEIVKGETAADESNLTGEATPVEKGIGHTVLAGTLNLWGAVEALVLRPASESALQKIVRLIQDAQHLKAPAQRFTDRFSSHYTYAVLALSLVMFFVWWLCFRLSPFTSTDTHASAFYRAMILLVVASPCALVLSIPSAVLAAIAWGARRGILFRGGAAVEKLAEIRIVALDKTGTLTTGELQVDRVESFPPGRETDVAQLAFSLDRLSAHPLARAITRHGKQQQLAALAFEHFESVTGQGLQARRDGKTCVLGRREWVSREGYADTIAQVPPMDPGFSEVWVAEGALVGRIVLRDDIRPQARSVVEELRHEGLRTVVLTGDRRATAEHLKTQLKLDDVRAELKPEEKVSIIRSFTEQHQPVAMVGDGVNDAPSLAAAHVGVAMGARGSDAALEQAEVVLMHDRLENFLAAFRLSQRARRIIRQNLVVSLGTVAVLVTFALAGKIPLTVGVLGHEGSTVIVVMNSLRLLFGGHSKPIQTG